MAGASDIAKLIADLVAAGTPPALVGRVAAALAAPSDDDELSADRRERDRIRKRIFRAKSNTASADRPRTVPRTEVASPPPVPPSPDKEIPRTPLENNLFPLTPTETPNPLRSGSVPLSDFDAFWRRYPNKVGKPDALKAFNRARQRVDQQTMMAGLEIYVGKQDDRPWCNPSTWLNQDRWNDRPAPRGSPHRMTRAEQLQEDLRQRILDEQNDQDPARSLNLEADERFPRLAYQHHGGRD